MDTFPFPPLRLMLSSPLPFHVSMLEPARPPTFIPEFSAGLSELATPFTENSFLESDEVAMLNIVWISETPRELAADHTWFIDIRTQDGEREVWHLLVSSKVIIRHLALVLTN
jgi:hypothetical protein